MERNDFWGVTSLRKLTIGAEEGKKKIQKKERKPEVGI